MRESESEISESVVSYPLQIATPQTNLGSLPSLPNLESFTQMTDSAFDSIETETKHKSLEKSQTEHHEKNKRALYKMEKKLGLNQKYLDEHRSTLSKQDMAKLKAEIERIKEGIRSLKGQIDTKQYQRESLQKTTIKKSL